MITKTATEAKIYRILEQVTDPEIPVLTIADIGVLRSVSVTDGGTIIVTITPTYSGCPALDVMSEDIVAALTDAGFDDIEVGTEHFPAWTTEWMTDDAKQKLADFGIAPPNSQNTGPILCPQCRSTDTATVSTFGSTACKALMVCSACGEPFDYFKSI